MWKTITAGWRWFWSDDDYDWLGTPPWWRWVVRVVLLLALVTLCASVFS